MNHRTSTLLFVLAFFLVIVGFSLHRKHRFRSQAKAGQPIVEAIENFKNRTGIYPESLSVLHINNAALNGWELQLITNNGVVSYGLKFYIGRGGVEYQPPHWFMNNEGEKKIIFTPP